VIAEKTCRFESSLATTVDEDGEFAFTAAIPASYVVFYDPTGEAIESWKEIDGVEMILDLEGLLPQNPAASTVDGELYDTFGGGGEITIHEGSELGIIDGKMAIVKGSITSEEYHLTMDFPDSEPITVEIRPGKTTELEFRTWIH
jgi:hypothetical protein